MEARRQVNQRRVKRGSVLFYEKRLNKYAGVIHSLSIVKFAILKT
jgi:hypothetical protein